MLSTKNYSKWQQVTNMSLKDRVQTFSSLMVNEAKQLMKTNSIQDGASLRSSLANLISGTYDNSDTLHNVYCDFGYPLSVTFKQLWNMYRRFGIAKNAVELPIEMTWLTYPEIKSENPQFVNDFEELVKTQDFWQRLKGVDTRQRVGRYAGLFMRVRDGLSPDKPIAETSLGLSGLVDIIPLYEGQLQVLHVDQDVLSDNYSRPIMYQLRAGVSGNRNEHASASVNIHPSRVVIAAEGADDGNIYGIPALEPCYNSLMDLRKIIGAGGEGFYRNAVQSIVFELMDTSKAHVNKDILEKFTTAFDDWIKNRARRSMMSPGMKPHVLTSSLSSSKDHFNAALNDVAAATKIPATILIGQQTGRLASSEDSRSFLSGINSRRQNYGAELITTAVEWLIKYGVLPTADFEIEWDDLLALSDTEKLDNAFKMADINSKQSGIGGEVIFSGDEIRESAGYDPVEDFEADGEELDDLDEDLEDGEENQS